MSNLTLDILQKAIDSIQLQSAPAVPPLFSSPHCVDHIQVKFPRSKKKRIQKKWSKNTKNWINKPWGYVVRTPFGIYGHPTIIARLQKEFKYNPCTTNTL